MLSRSTKLEIFGDGLGEIYLNDSPEIGYRRSEKGRHTKEDEAPSEEREGHLIVMAHDKRSSPAREYFPNRTLNDTHFSPCFGPLTPKKS